MPHSERHLPLLLIILDGWGIAPDQADNAITNAHTPHWDQLQQSCPHTAIEGSGIAVGLPQMQMGNSEVGHLTMGAGRTVYQDLTRIDLAIQEGTFFENEVLQNAFRAAAKSGGNIHMMGLLSDGGVHAHIHHLQAFIEMAPNLQGSHLYVHAFLDGRDTPPQSAKKYIQQLSNVLEEKGSIVSICGRYYAMDRDQRWDRIEKAYRLIAEGSANFQAESPLQALQAAYERQEFDEFVPPTKIGNYAGMSPNDVVIFMNFRSDRARELTRALTDPAFTFFERKHCLPKKQFVSLTRYDETFNLPIAFPPISLNQLLGECLSAAHLSQLRLAETEKYAHVTFFFNGGNEIPYPGEERKLIASPKVATYDLQPEMSASELTEQLCQAIKEKSYDVIICNYANADMVGHTGNFEATKTAIETLDTCLGKIIETLTTFGGEALITADHGNAERMFDNTTQQAHTAHTSDPVPLLYFGRQAKVVKKDGTLADVAPTLLYLLNLPQPVEMTGKKILELA